MASSTGAAASLIALTEKGRLYGIRVYNSNLAARYVQLYDAATLPADGAGTEPLVSKSIAATSYGEIPFPEGRRMTAGIVVCNSTTGHQKTIGAADMLFDVTFALT